MSTCENTIAIAGNSHAGQQAALPGGCYLHPLRVMLSVNILGEKGFAALHDLVEACSEWTVVRLSIRRFTETVIDCWRSVTKMSRNEGHDLFMGRARGCTL